MMKYLKEILSNGVRYQAGLRHTTFRIPSQLGLTGLERESRRRACYPEPEMAYLSSSRSLARRLLTTKPAFLHPKYLLSSSSSPYLPEPSTTPQNVNRTSAISSRVFCSRSLNLDEAQGPAPIDYRSLLQEDEFHSLADSTIHDLQEKFEEYGDSVQIDGFDVDYGNQVLTLKLGSLGTYVLNKQTPNRQIWLSSPLSGPSRFDWDSSSQAWVYRRTKAKLLQLLESEVEQLCGKPISLS
ncbi:Frataxin/CyaY [Macleaya cordata]|uniref:ferroxidase n=1 Tax=Macleaya cordata TaxID=56857 RepID=A0A200QBU8_MACCD|nr:Frataxin/CyaY [Macleaya cordata]